MSAREENEENLRRDSLQQSYVSIARDMRDARNSLWSAVSGLTVRGEKLERLANLGAELAEYAGAMHTESQRRRRSVKFKAFLTLAIVSLCGVLTGLYLYTFPLNNHRE